MLDWLPALQEVKDRREAFQKWQWDQIMNDLAYITRPIPVKPKKKLFRRNK